MYQIILFWNDILRVSDGLSVHHQEFKVVHPATGICQTDTVSPYHSPLTVHKNLSLKH